MGGACVTMVCISVVLGFAKLLLILPVKPGKDE